jgi:hypothetical protein
MATIACLGWGSLVWDKREFPIKGKWLRDGPQVRVEFLRKSDKRRTRNGRITLVLHRSAAAVPSLWAIMNCPDLQSAIEALRVREGTSIENIKSWTKGRSPANIVGLPTWARERKIDAVIWTALGPEFDGKTRKRSEKQIVSYLAGLTGDDRARAEEYVRRAPPQIATNYRRAIEAAVKWTPQLPKKEK